MKINFSQLLQESWNFMRNQQVFSLSFTLIFFSASLITWLLASNIDVEQAQLLLQQAQQNQPDPQQLAEVATSGMSWLLITQLINSFIVAWGLVQIHAISQRQGNNYRQSASQAFSRFLGMLLIYFIILFPILIAFSDAYVGAALLNRAPSSVSLLALVLGFFMFTRLCLAPLYYLLEQRSIGQSFKQAWQQSNKRQLVLIGYCAIMYLLFPMLLRSLDSLSINSFTHLIISFCAAFINLFSLIFSYRFFSLFTQRA